MRTVALYSIKGGVGKTSTAVNLACLAARDGARTLLVDLDPQGAASFCLRVPAKMKGGAATLVRRGASLEKTLRGTNQPGLDLLPADFSFRHLDLELDARRAPRRRLRERLGSLAADYDLAFLDCPPGITLVSESVFRAARLLLVPLVPGALAMRTFDQLLGHLAGMGDRAPAVAGFLSMVDLRRREHRARIAAGDSRLLDAAIPYSADVERMGTERVAVVNAVPHSPASLAYERLWAALQKRLGP